MWIGARQRAWRQTNRNASQPGIEKKIEPSIAIAPSVNPTNQPAHQSCNKPRQARRRSKSSAGFTLIEALVALTILALSLTVLFQSYSSGLTLVRTMDDHLNARTLARSLLSEGALLASTTNLNRQGREGALDWSLTVSPAPVRLSPDDERNPWRLYQVTATVDIPGRRPIRLDTLVMGSKR